ncbi:hypothetical protein [Catenulispora pinisilvae]|uniref:hypothetical protein n=1 Tax=Catenulispora pinisilvae TaxID=2705253 RepID=UPI001892186C|nr:hypothetical protein [Catenulispora pinisilvae]
MTPEFLTAVAESAGRVADTFQSLPFRADRPYDPRPVATVAAEELAVLCDVVAALDRPLVVDADVPTRTEPLGVDLAGLMSFLQLVAVLYHGLETVPPVLTVSAGRNLSATQLIARRVRDRARKEAIRA